MTVSTGIITTIAGTGTSSYSGDNGPATSAALNYPSCVQVDSTGIVDPFLSLFLLIFYFLYSLGNVYIADRDNQRIRKVTISTGIITTIAGNGGAGSFSGDGGQATAASLYFAAGLCLDDSGNHQQFFSLLFVSYSHLHSPRQRVYFGSLQSSYPQGDDLHRDYHHYCRDWEHYFHR